MKILVADDDSISRHLLERLLVQWNYEVVTAADGDEAFWILQKDDGPRLAILDWMMPTMDGVEICRELRRQRTEPYVYILLLTAKTQKEDLIEGLDAGADDYLTKPFDPDELRVRLRAGRRILELQEHLIASREAARFPSTHDALTGIWNREAALAVLRRELAQPHTPDRPTSVILADLDHFQSVNATYGRLVGDLILREMARRIKSVRLFDVVGRYGGAAFLVVMPDADEQEAQVLAAKVCAVISQNPVDTLGGAVQVTASLGVATARAGTDSAALLRAAENAVAKAKSHGRCRVEVGTLTQSEPAAIVRMANV